MLQLAQGQVHDLGLGCKNKGTAGAKNIWQWGMGRVKGTLPLPINFSFLGL